MEQVNNNGCGGFLDSCGCLLIILLIFIITGGHLFVRCGSKSIYIGSEPEQKQAKVKECNILEISEK